MLIDSLMSSKAPQLLLLPTCYRRSGRIVPREVQHERDRRQQTGQHGLSR